AARPLRALRAAALRARARRSPPAASSRVLPRPRARRVDAVRRRARAGERRAAARPLGRRSRTRAEARGGRAMGLLKLLDNVREGRVQRLLSLVTALSAPPLAFEVYLEHYKGSFGDKWMWTPIVLTPPLTAAGIAGFYSEKAAKPGLPRQRRGITPGMVGRYPDFDVLEGADHWDEVTRKMILDRVRNVPPIRFFDNREAATLNALCDHLTGQIGEEPKLPVLAYVD